MDAQLTDFVLWLIGVYYGVYALISIAVTFLMYRVVVVPILSRAPRMYTVKAKPRAIACLWGFWIFWQYVVAVFLLLFWRVLLGILCPFCRSDLRSSTFWTPKERRFLQSTPVQMFADWVRDYFARYYPPVIPPESFQ